MDECFFVFKKLDFFGLGDMFELAPCLTLSYEFC